jgi:nucleotide-binding universal stress UspA family protein
VLSRGEAGEIPPETGSILTGCGRPILLVPPAIPEDFSGTVAIAWKETAEAARAVTAAMPILKKASRIVVLSANESGEAAQAEASAVCLADQLRWHGVKVQAHQVPLDMLAPAEAVLAVAADMGAALVVMGGYGHSRAIEFVLGGFTRYALGHTQLPILLAH